MILGEGPEDIGKIDETARYPGCDFEGDLPRLVRRIVTEAGGQDRFGYAVETIRAIVARIPRTGTPARAGGKGKDLRDAVLSCLIADGQALPAAVVAVIDARANEVVKLRQDIQKILVQCRERAPEVPVAIGLAIHEIEIWMLADPMSREAAFGPALARVTLPDDLEAEPDPKARWAEIAGRVERHQDLPHALHHDQLRRAAWESLRCDVVSRACPQGFAPFTAEARTALGFLLRRRS
jgi:hypothetical protein